VVLSTRVLNVTKQTVVNRVGYGVYPVFVLGSINCFKKITNWNLR